MNRPGHFTPEIEEKYGGVDEACQGATGSEGSEEVCSWNISRVGDLKYDERCTMKRSRVEPDYMVAGMTKTHGKMTPLVPRRISHSAIRESRKALQDSPNLDDDPGGC